AARAPVTPPLTGASRNETPRGLARGSILRGVEGSTLLRSTRIVPGLARSTSPPGSRYTASTSGEAGKHVSTTSLCSTTSRAEAAALAPPATRVLGARAWLSDTPPPHPPLTTLD